MADSIGGGALADVTNDDGDGDSGVVIVIDDCRDNQRRRSDAGDAGAMTGGDEKGAAERKAALKAEKAAVKAAKEAEKTRVKAEKEAERTRVAEEKEALKAEKAKVQAERDAKERAAKEEKARVRAEKEAERERVVKEKEAKAAEKAKVQAEKEAEERAAKEKAAKQANKFVSFFKTPVKKKAVSMIDGMVAPEVSPAVKEKLDEIVKAEGAAEDIGTVREDLLNRWRTNKDKRKIVNRWAARRVNRDVEVVSILISPSGKRSRGEMEKLSGARRRRLFMIDCNEFARPAFWGTGPFPSRPKASATVTGRAPFKMDVDVDYEYDSAEDWVEEEPGESLSDADDGDEEAMSNNSDDDDDGFIASDDEMTSAKDVAMFDAATVGDDEELSRMRRKLSLLVSRAKRAQTPLIITTLAPSTPDGGDQRMGLDENSDVSLLDAFAIESSPDAPRVTLSMEASTSQQTSPHISARKTVTTTASKKNADEIVAANLRPLIECLLKNPKMRVGQVTEKFIEEASSFVAGLTKSAVKRKIAEIATYQSRWLITSASLEAVSLSEEDATALRPIELPKVKSTAKKMKPNASVANAVAATPRTLESCFKGAKVKENSLPTSVDDEQWTPALMSLQQTKTNENWPGHLKHIFDVSNLCACVENGAVPMYFLTALMKTASLRSDKRMCRLACARLVGPMLKKLAVAAKNPQGGEHKATAPIRATIELACADTSLIAKFIEVNIEGDNIILKESALDVVFALIDAESVPASAQRAIRTHATTVAFLEFLAAALECENLRYKSARVTRSVLRGTHVEICAAFRPAQVAALAEALVESIRKAQSTPSADSLKYLPNATRALANIAQGSPDSIDFAQMSVVLADLIERCTRERDGWDATMDAIVDALEKTSDAFAGAKAECADRVSSALRSSTNARAKALAATFAVRGDDTLMVD